jgi:O-acetyl-ADP-ribose deacetylase (regulator of RNase III)
MKITLAGGRTIELVLGDITHEETDAIVNAANSSLLGGGGVDGAIHRAGGPEILEACRAIRAERGLLPPGQAVSTTGGRLRARHVIHTVGPIWNGGLEGEPETLASCHQESLRIADELRAASVSFPAISTGVYGYPVGKAAQVAVTAVKNTLPGCRHVLTVRFVLFDQAAFDAFAEAM